jgi:hypothetical protein
MKFTDEILMSFADGELAEPMRSQVERAVRADPDVAARVAQHRALRARVYNSFSRVLDEPVPQRLRSAAAGAKVVHLDAVRASRQPPPAQAQAPQRSGWQRWGALAASLVVGVLAGAMGWQNLQADPLVALNGDSGALVARGTLAQALSQQLASSNAADATVRIGVSFVARDGNYCRSFALGSTAGLACGNGARWTIPVLAEQDAPAGTYRQAGATMPPAVLEAIDQRIDGMALDAAGERTARQRGWKRPG